MSQSPSSFIHHRPSRKDLLAATTTLGVKSFYWIGSRLGPTSPHFPDLLQAYSLFWIALTALTSTEDEFDSIAEFSEVLRSGLSVTDTYLRLEGPVFTQEHQSQLSDSLSVTTSLHPMLNANAVYRASTLLGAQLSELVLEVTTPPGVTAARRPVRHRVSHNSSTAGEQHAACTPYQQPHPAC